MKKIFVPFCIFLIIAAGCSGKNSSIKAKDDSVDKTSNTTMSMWLPEWQMKSALSDVKNSIVGLENIHVFGAYFNEKDQLFLTDDAEKLVNHSNEQFPATNKIILTVVNDYVVVGSPSIQKDSKLLHRLLESPQSRQKHINNIMELVNQYEVDGVEIDYEKIPKEDTGNYVLFLEELYKQLTKNNRLMYVVLVPSFPFETKLPNGPKYTVMAYNVHGYHSGPGAKATFSFLDQLMDKVKKSNQNFAIAFATGGFLWKENGKVIALTEIEAKEILASTGITPKRDQASEAVFFQYIDNKNQRNEVWFADTETLQKWVLFVRDSGFKDIYLWRAGGLSTDTLKWVQNYD